jgi:hypothetical protein
LHGVCVIELGEVKLVTPDVVGAKGGLLAADGLAVIRTQAVLWDK